MSRAYSIRNTPWQGYHYYGVYLHICDTRNYRYGDDSPAHVYTTLTV